MAVVQQASAFIRDTNGGSLALSLPTAPTSGNLVLALMHRDKNAGTITHPTGHTLRSTYVNTSVSIALADTTGPTNGGTWSWTGTGTGTAVALAETDHQGATFVTASSFPSPVNDTAVTSITGTLGNASAAGIVFAMVSVDSSWDGSGPFNTSATVTPSAGWTRVVGPIQEAVSSGTDSGGVNIQLFQKPVASGESTSFTLSWTGGSDQAALILAHYSLATNTNVSAGSAALSVAANNATVSTSAATAVTAGTATGTVVAHNASGQAVTNSGEATLGVAALNPTVSTERTPGQVLNIGQGPGKNHFSVDVAEAGAAERVLYETSQIEAGLDIDPEFTASTDNQWAQFSTRVDAPTTSGSTFPRSELRESTPGSDVNYGFNPADGGTHWIRARIKFTELPPDKPEIVGFQLHSSADDVIQVRTQLVSGQIKLVLRVNGTGVGIPRFSELYSVGTEFDCLLEIIGDTCRVYYNNLLIPHYSFPVADMPVGTSYYWKTGNYLQSNEDSETVDTVWGTTHVQNLLHWHTGWDPPENYFGLPEVSAGTDATTGAGQQFNRTATESGDGITARQWAIISGPTGAGTSLGTAAALSWTPTTPGTYRLRYGATNAEGTGIDDVLVTVAAATSVTPDPALITVTGADAAPATVEEPLEATLGVAAHNPSVATTGETPGTLTSAWLGIEHISLRLADGTGQVRVDFSTSSSMTSPISSINVTPDSLGNARVPLPTLNADTLYYYRAFRGGSYIGTATQFRTLPGTSFSFGFASCRSHTAAEPSPNPTALADAVTRGINFWLWTGDIHYRDISTNTPSSFRTGLDELHTRTNIATILNTVPSSYTWSDHDYGGDSSDGDTASKPAAQSVYRERVPHPTLPSGTGGIYHTFKVGRVRFIMLDTRSYRSDWQATDNSSKEMLGTEQKAWLQDLLNNADTPVTVIVSDVPWIGGSGEDDHWGSYQTARTEVAGYITANAAKTKVIFLCGDAHMLAIDNGTNSAGGAPVYHAAALNRFTSTKGGPYSGGSRASTNAYGRVVVTDTGTQIQFAYSGYYDGGTLWSTHTTTVNTTTTVSAGSAALTVAANSATPTSERSGGSAELSVSALNATVTTAGATEVVPSTANTSVIAENAFLTSGITANSAAVGVAALDATVDTASSGEVVATTADLAVSALNPSLAATRQLDEHATVGVAAQDANITIGRVVEAVTAELGLAAHGTVEQVVTTPIVAMLVLAAMDPDALVPEVFGTIIAAFRAGPSIRGGDRAAPAIIGIRRDVASTIWRERA